jgi:hypothetical protein
MSYRISGLDPAPFQPLFGLSQAELRAHGAERHVATTKPGFPDRIELRDAEPGETLLLLNYEHQPAPTPYRASHAIFVREGAAVAFASPGVVPEALRIRQISLRAFDDLGSMIDADLIDGRELETSIQKLFHDPAVAYLHAHYAKRGCYAARVDRA